MNDFGESPFSPVGQGGIIKKVPDSPVSLVNDESVTNDLTIRFTWSAGAHDGGTPVLDYSVYYDEGLGTSDFKLI